MHTPWRDRPDSFLRGYVLGSVVGGWGSAILYTILWAISGDPWCALLIVIAATLGALGTYMWYHG